MLKRWRTVCNAVKDLVNLWDSNSRPLIHETRALTAGLILFLYYYYFYYYYFFFSGISIMRNLWSVKLSIFLQAAAKNPHDSQHQENLKSAAENLRAATNAATQNALRRKLVQRLEKAAKHAAVSATQATVAANASEMHNSNKTSANQLATHVKVTLLWRFAMLGPCNKITSHVYSELSGNLITIQM